jgi:SpoVK/Ycf46/Vps4 family AAA+-type ATPase
MIGKEYLGRFTTGDRHKPSFSSTFPARRITTTLEWNDLVLPEAVLEDVEEIAAWIRHQRTLLGEWHLDQKFTPGFRSLFYGPPGTGKTLTAALLGKATGRDVYRVDLSLVISKWVGETEKNLANVFDQAEASDWILFFDEADALFGKRTNTTSANDRYGNQEVAYLLQRVEDCPGVVILASNLKGNIDEAFARRFQSMIYFPIPGPDERLRLWRHAFSKPIRLERGADLAQVAERFEVTGGAIVNVLRYAALMALRRGVKTIRLHDITDGIRRELRKDGKVI